VLSLTSEQKGSWMLLRELAFLHMVERGLDDSAAGRTISHEDMLNRIRSWQR